MVTGCAEDLEDRRPKEGMVEVWWGCHVGKSRSISAGYGVEYGVKSLQKCRSGMFLSKRPPRGDSRDWQSKREVNGRARVEVCHSRLASCTCFSPSFGSVDAEDWMVMRARGCRER